MIDCIDTQRPRNGPSGLEDALRDAAEGLRAPQTATQWMAEFSVTRGTVYRTVRARGLQAAVIAEGRPHRDNSGLADAMRAAVKGETPARTVSQWATEFGVKAQTVRNIACRKRLHAAVLPAEPPLVVKVLIEPTPNANAAGDLYDKLCHRIGKTALGIAGLLDTPLREVRVPAVRDTSGRIVQPGRIIIEADDAVEQSPTTPADCSSRPNNIERN